MLEPDVRPEVQGEPDPVREEHFMERTLGTFFGGPLLFDGSIFLLACSLYRGRLCSAYSITLRYVHININWVR